MIFRKFVSVTYLRTEKMQMKKRLINVVCSSSVRTLIKMAYHSRRVTRSAGWLLLSMRTQKV